MCSGLLLNFSLSFSRKKNFSLLTKWSAQFFFTFTAYLTEIFVVQIFVRQKNRSSSKAPDNPIKVKARTFPFTGT
jgi:hypothetical protein